MQETIKNWRMLRDGVGLASEFLVRVEGAIGFQFVIVFYTFRAEWILRSANVLFSRHVLFWHKGCVLGGHVGPSSTRQRD